MSVKDLLADLRATEPRYRDLPDAVVEAMESKADPRMEHAFANQRRLDDEQANKLPAPPDPSTFEDPISRAVTAAGPMKPTFDPTPADVRESLPAIGGAVGGVLGGGAGLATSGFGVVPGAVGGAALGAAGGEAWRQNIRRWQGLDSPATPLEAAGDITKEAAINAATEVTGGLANRAAVGVGRGLVKYAAAPTRRLMEEFPTVIEDFLKSRGGVRFTEGGKGASDAATTASREAVEKMIAEAEGRGVEGLDLLEDVIKPTQASVGPQAQRQAKLGVEHSVPSLEGRLGRIKDEWFNPKGVSQKPTVTTRRAGKAAPYEPPPAVPPTKVVEVKAEKVVVPKKGKKAKDLAEEFGARPAEEATDLVTDTSHSGMGAFRDEPWKATADASIPTPPRPPTRRWIDPEPPPFVPEVGPRVLTGEGGAATQLIPPKVFSDIPLTEAQALKREAQDLADTAFRTQDRGGNINAIDMATDKALATSFKEGIERKVSGVKDLNDATRRQMGVSFLIEDALARRGGLPSNVISGGLASSAVPLFATGNIAPAIAALGTGAAVKGLTSPAALGAAAKTAYRTAPYHGLTQKAMLEGLRRLLAETEGTSEQ